MSHRFRWPVKLAMLGMLAAVIATASTTASAASKHQIKAKGTLNLAVLEDMTGATGSTGGPSVHGAALAVAEANAHGLVHGYKLGIKVYDTASNAALAPTLSLQAASDKSVVGIVGLGSTGAVQSAAPVLQQQGIFAVTPQATGTLAPAFLNRWWARAVPVETAALPQVMKALHKYVKYSKVAVVYNTIAASQVLLAQRLASNCPDFSCTVSDSFGAPSTTTDFTSFISKLRADPPDLCYVATVGASAINFIQQVRDAGLKCTFVGTAAFAAFPFSTVASASEGALVWTNYDAQGTRKLAKNFIARYEKKWHGEVPNQNSAATYDATRMFIYALNKAGVKSSVKATRTALRAVILRLKNFPGVNSVGYTFSGGSENLTPTDYLGKVHNGVLSTVGFVSLDAKAYLKELKAIEPGA